MRHKNIPFWLFFIGLGIIFMLTDGGMVLGAIMLAIGVIILLIRIFYKQTAKEHPEKKIKIKRKHENPLYGGLLLLLIGFFAIIAEVGTTFPIILMVIGGLLVIGTLFYIFVIDIPRDSVPKPSQTPNQTPASTGKPLIYSYTENNQSATKTKQTNITPLVYNESLKGFMDMFSELAEEFGKVDNFEKNCHLLKEKVVLLQGFYGYALQNLENRGKILTALAFYYLFNVDGLVWIYTRQETTDEQFADILQLIVDASDDENLDDDIEFVMKNIVDGYFMWRQEEIPLDDYDYQKPIKKEILPSLDWNKDDK